MWLFGGKVLQAVTGAKEGHQGGVAICEPRREAQRSPAPGSASKTQPSELWGNSISPV